MIVMTDGQANLPGSVSTACAAVLTEAQAASAAGIKIVTVTVGLDADTALMQQVASIGGGECFIVPGNQSVADVQAQLMEVFIRIASTRPLKLIK